MPRLSPTRIMLSNVLVGAIIPWIGLTYGVKRTSLMAISIVIFLVIGTSESWIWLKCARKELNVDQLILGAVVGSFLAIIGPFGGLYVYFQLFKVWTPPIFPIGVGSFFTAIIGAALGASIVAAGAGLVALAMFVFSVFIMELDGLVALGMGIGVVSVDAIARRLVRKLAPGKNTASLPQINKQFGNLELARWLDPVTIIGTSLLIWWVYPRGVSAVCDDSQIRNSTVCSAGFYLLNASKGEYPINAYIAWNFHFFIFAIRSRFYLQHIDKEPFRLWAVRGGAIGMVVAFLVSIPLGIAWVNTMKSADIGGPLGVLFMLWSVSTIMGTLGWYGGELLWKRKFGASVM